MCSCNTTCFVFIVVTQRDVLCIGYKISGFFSGNTKGYFVNC